MIVSESPIVVIWNLYNYRKNRVETYSKSRVPLHHFPKLRDAFVTDLAHKILIRVIL